MKTLLFAISFLALFAAGSEFSVALAKGDGGAACIKRQMAKGRSACIAKATCNGVTSRKQLAQMCG